MVTLSALLKVVYDCFLYISIKNKAGLEVMLYDDDYEYDGRIRLERIKKEFGNFPVEYVAAGSTETMYITLQGEYDTSKVHKYAWGLEYD